MKKLIFILFGITCLFSSPVYSEVILDEAYSYEADEYLIGGENVGCGIRFSAMNRKFILINGSFWVQLFKNKGAVWILKITAKKISSLNGKVSSDDLYVDYGWLKTGSGSTFKESKSSRGGKGNHFFALSPDFLPSAKIFFDATLGNLTIGFNQKPNTFDTTFELTKPPNKEIGDKLFKCMADFKNSYKEEFIK